MNGSECKYSISRPYNLIDDSTFYKTCKDYTSTLHYRLSLIPRTVESKPSVPITIFNLLFPKWTKKLKPTVTSYFQDINRGKPKVAKVCYQI